MTETEQSTSEERFSITLRSVPDRHVGVRSPVDGSALRVCCEWKLPAPRCERVGAAKWPEERPQPIVEAPGR